MERCADQLDDDIQALCYEYSSLVSMWVINEMTANQITFEEASRRLVNNFLVIDIAKNMSSMGQRLIDRDAEEVITGEL